MQQEPLLPDPQNDPRRSYLNQKAVDAWGTAIVLDRRINCYRTLIRLNGYLGFIIPVIVGVMALAFGASAQNFTILLSVAAGMLAIQAVMSATLVFYETENKLQVAQNSSSTNKIFAVDANDLAKNTILNNSIYSSFYSELKGKITAQESHDERLDFSDKDRRRAARAGMKRFAFSCNKCVKIPSSTSAKADKSKCPNCGNF